MANYSGIRVWGRMLGSFTSFIEREIEAAQEDGAPRDAIYRRTNYEDRTNEWATARECCPETRKQVEKAMDPDDVVPDEPKEPQYRCGACKRTGTLARDADGVLCCTACGMDSPEEYEPVPDTPPPLCPYCHQPTRKIEDCECDSDERKTSWTCDCSDANAASLIIYTHTRRAD